MRVVSLHRWPGSLVRGVARGGVSANKVDPLQGNSLKKVTQKIYTPHSLMMHAPLSCLLSKEELFVRDTTTLLRRKHTASEVTIYERQGYLLCGVHGP